MISNLTPEEQKAWERQMAQYVRRQKRQLRWELIKRIGAPVVLVACLIVTVCTCWPASTSPREKMIFYRISDSFYRIRVPDSLILVPSGPGREDFVINPEIQREYDSIVAEDTFYINNSGQPN